MDRGNSASVISIVLAACLVLLAADAAAIDPPHNGQNSPLLTMTCSSCHYDTTGPSPSWVTQPSTTDGTFLNNMCTSCHNPAVIPDSRFVVKTHSSGNTSSKYGTWTIECRSCHNPHYQDQASTFALDPAADLVACTVTSTCDQSLNPVTAAESSLGVSGGLVPGAWIDHVFVPNTAYPTKVYRIKSNTASAVTICGPFNCRYVGFGKTCAIRYGRMVKAAVTTPASGVRTVKFFNSSGPGSFATSTSAENMTSLCQVCHTRTGSFNSSGVLEGPGHPSFQAGGNCTICHEHASGFKPQCGTCHGEPPIAASLGGPDGLANNEGGTGSATPGAHAKHVVSLDYLCDTCHAGGMPASPVYDKMIQIGFAAPGGVYDGRSSLANGYNYTPGAAGTIVTRSGSMTCSSLYCHSNGASVAAGGAPTGTSPDWGAGTIVCGSCHGYPPAYANGSPKANSHGLHAYGCGSCHAATTIDGSTISDRTYHVNGVYDVVPGAGRDFSYSFAAQGGTCAAVSCHGGAGGRWGGSACLDCHAVVQGNRTAISPQFTANSHHVQGPAVSGTGCYQCHWEANSDGSINPAYHGGPGAPGSPVNLVIYGAGVRPASYAAGSTAVEFLADGSRAEVEKITNHCLGCHSDQNNGTEPFGDGKTPMQYAWDGTSVAARYSQTGTTTWGKYTAVTNAAPKNITKAYSAHGNLVNNQRGWNTTTGVDGPITNTGGNVNVQCFDCHNAHGSMAPGVTTRYTSATVNGGILKDTTAGLGGYSMTYRPVSGGTVSDKNVRSAGASLCLDCHLTQDAGATPWGYGSTFGATQPVIGYYDSQFLAPGATGSQLRYPYKALRYNAGGHFGASSPLSTAPLAPIGGLCTACHDPHGVSPTLGANEQYGVPMLRGTWLTSPYREDAAPALNDKGTVRDATYPFGFDQTAREGVQYHIDQNTFGANIKATIASGITETEGQFAGLCLSCHPRSSLTDGVNGGTWKSMDRIHESVKGWGANAKHNYVCSKCHSPHNGSALPRLMVTNCLNKEHKGRVGFNPSPVLGGSGYGDDGGCWGDSVTLGGCPYYPMDTFAFSSGAGRFPGTFDGYYYTNNYGPGAFSVSCHEGMTGSTTDQTWNSVTPWIVSP